MSKVGEIFEGAREKQGYSFFWGIFYNKSVKSFERGGYYLYQIRGVLPLSMKGGITFIN